MYAETVQVVVDLFQGSVMNVQVFKERCRAATYISQNFGAQGKKFVKMYKSHDLKKALEEYEKEYGQSKVEFRWYEVEVM